MKYQLSKVGKQAEAGVRDRTPAEKVQGSFEGEDAGPVFFEVDGCPHVMAGVNSLDLAFL